MIKKVTAALSELLDRWTDIGLLRLSLMFAVTLLVMTGCDNSCVCHYNDSLSERMAPVKVHIQWDERFQETPSGVTVMAYGANGCLYNSVKSNRTDYAEMFLPQGEFTLVAFNQSLNELLPIWFDTYEKFDLTRITLSELETPPTFELENIKSDLEENPNQGSSENEEDVSQNGSPSSTSFRDGTTIGEISDSDSGIRKDNSDGNHQTESKDKVDLATITKMINQPFVQPSPWFALSAPIVVNIAEEELMNINTNCKCKVCCCQHLHDAATTTHSVTIKLVPQVYTLIVNLQIRNLTSLASVRSYVSSLNRSINLEGEPLQEKASMVLDQWQKSMTTETDGLISSRTQCLSMALTDATTLVIEFTLSDGKTVFVETLPLKDHVSVDHKAMTITADLELVEPLPKVEGEPTGGFWVTVTDWGEPTDIDI